MLHYHINMPYRDIIIIMPHSSITRPHRVIKLLYYIQYKHDKCTISFTMSHMSFTCFREVEQRRFSPGLGVVVT